MKAFLSTLTLKVTCLRAVTPICLLATLACLLFAPQPSALAVPSGTQVQRSGQWCVMTSNITGSCLVPCTPNGPPFTVGGSAGFTIPGTGITFGASAGTVITPFTDTTLFSPKVMHQCADAGSPNPDMGSLCCMVWTHCGTQHFYNSSCVTAQTAPAKGVNHKTCFMSGRYGTTPCRSAASPQDYIP